MNKVGGKSNTGEGGRNCMQVVPCNTGLTSFISVNFITHEDVYLCMGYINSKVLCFCGCLCIKIC
jgi:hypothetical protein